MANTKDYKMPYPLWGGNKRHPRMMDLYRLKNIENDLNDFIKFQEAEHARFMQYAGDTIFREMFHGGVATYANSTEYSSSGVTIAAGATTKVPVGCTLTVANDYNPDYYQTAWLQAFNCNIGGVARITLNKFEHNEQNHTLRVEGGVFVFNPKTTSITVTDAAVHFIIGKDLQKAWRTFTFNNYTEQQP